MLLVFWLRRLRALVGIVCFFLAVPTGDLAEILLLASFFFLLGRHVEFCGWNTTGTGTSLFHLSFYSLPIFLLFFFSFLGDGLGSLLESLGAIRRLRLQNRSLWLSFFGLFVTWLLDHQLGIQRSVASGASLIKGMTGESLELGLGFGSGRFLDQIVSAKLLLTFFVDLQFYRRSEVFIKVSAKETF